MVAQIAKRLCWQHVRRRAWSSSFSWKHQIEFDQFFGRTSLHTLHIAYYASLLVPSTHLKLFYLFLLKGCLTKGSLVVWIVFVNPGCPNNFLYRCHLCEAMSTHTDPLIIRRAAFKCIYFSTKCLPPVLFHWMTTTCTFLKGLLNGN